MLITWDAAKNQANLTKHKVDFEFAQLVFRDPFHETFDDPHRNEPRLRTIGIVGTVCLFVVYTYDETGEGEDHIHIISARRAEANERRAYEKGRTR